MEQVALFLPYLQQHLVYIHSISFSAQLSVKIRHLIIPHKHNTAERRYQKIRPVNPPVKDGFHRYRSNGPECSCPLFGILIMSIGSNRTLLQMNRLTLPVKEIVI